MRPENEAFIRAITASAISGGFKLKPVTSEAKTPPQEDSSLAGTLKAAIMMRGRAMDSDDDDDEGDDWGSDED